MHEAQIGELTDAMTALIFNGGKTEQLLRDHQRRDDGRCSCSTTSVDRPYPCSVRRAGVRAHELVLASRPRLARMS